MRQDNELGRKLRLKFLAIRRTIRAGQQSERENNMSRLLLVALCLVGVVSFAHAKESAPPIEASAVEPAPKLIQWEYKVIIRSGPLQEFELNELGARGWELATMCQSDTNTVLTTFKRPRTQADIKHQHELKEHTNSQLHFKMDAAALHPKTEISNDDMQKVVSIKKKIAGLRQDSMTNPENKEANNVVIRGLYKEFSNIFSE